MKKPKAEEEYADIFYLPHHQSEFHPHMSMAERAAQFSAFSALKGGHSVLPEAEAAALREEE